MYYFTCFIPLHGGHELSTHPPGPLSHLGLGFDTDKTDPGNNCASQPCLHCFDTNPLIRTATEVSFRKKVTSGTTVCENQTMLQDCCYARVIDRLPRGGGGGGHGHTWGNVRTLWGLIEINTQSPCIGGNVGK